MPKVRIAIVAAAVVAVVLIAVAIETGNDLPDLSARVVKLAEMTNGLEIRVQLTNSTSYTYFLAPTRLDIYKDGNWQFLTTRSHFFLDTPNIYGHGTTEFGWLTMQPKHGARCRVVIDGQRAKRGIRSFFFRVRQRLRGDFAMPLNPFDATPIVYTDTIAITEFKAP